MLMTSIGRILVGITFVIGMVVTGTVAYSTQQGGRAEEERLRHQQMAVYRQLGLEAAARLTGSLSMDAPVHSGGGPADMRELATTTPIIIVGTASRHTMRINIGDSLVNTYYQVEVEQVIKGRGVFPQDTVTVIVPGGRVTLSDGTQIQMNVQDYVPPTNGRPHVWFVEDASFEARHVTSPVDGREAIRGRMLVPVDVRLGIYDLQPKRAPMVVPAGNVRSPLGRDVALQNAQATEFVKWVESAANSY